jgi:hypothetical protein
MRESATPGTNRRVCRGPGLLELVGSRQRGEPRDDAVGVEAVRRRIAALARIGHAAGGLESERREFHSGRVQVLVGAALGVHTIEAADHIAVDHVDHRLGDRIFDALDRVHAFLDDHLGYVQAFLDHRHFVALLAVQVAHLRGVAHHHHAHPVGAGVGFDRDIRRFLDPVLEVFDADLLEQRGDVRREAVLAFARLEVDLSAACEVRVDQPGVDLDQRREFAYDFVIPAAVIRLAADRPARVQRREQHLLVKALQDRRNTRREVVVQQDRAGIEVAGLEPCSVAAHRLEQDARAARGFELGRRADLGIERADAHLEPGLAQDRGQHAHVLEVPLVARVILGDQQQVLRVRTDLVDRRHRRLNRERRECGAQVVEPAGKQVGVDRRDLEARVAQVAGRVERRRMRLPLEPQPALDRRGCV